MKDELLYAWAPIVNKSRNDDGTYTVFGKVAGPDLDSDQQVMNEAWMKAALPAWFSSGANVREQHAQIAAGRGIELTESGDAWMLKTLVVDPVSCAKIEADVLQGYSVGIKNGKILTKSARAPKGEIVGGSIVEVSLVDRPANETCRLTIVKSASDGGAEIIEKPEFVVWDEVTKSYVPDPSTSKRAQVEELIKKAVEANTVKSDEAGPLKAAIDSICELIRQEAAELEGDFSEVYDIETLLCALRSLRDFWWSESSSGEVPAPDSTGTDVLEGGPMEFSTVADLVKAASAEDASDDDKAALVELRKAVLGDAEFITKADHEESVKTAVAESTKDLAERVETLSKAAAPSGPVKSRTQGDAIVATAREDHLTKAATYDRLAAQVTDRDMSSEYRSMATSEREAAERLVTSAQA